MAKYSFVVNDAKTEVLIYTMSRIKGISSKYIGKIIKAADGRCIQEFESDVCWLPVKRALAAMGEISQEDAVLAELGY